MRRDEQKIYGRHACAAFFAKRPSDLIRVALDEASAGDFAELMRYCAANKLSYRIAPREELEKLSGARHHEGICVVARPPDATDLKMLLAESGPGLLVALDKVGNPHNVGTMVRTGAHFGARALIAHGMVRLPPAAYRTAEGGAEHLAFVHTDDLQRSLIACKQAGYEVVATSSHDGDSLYEKPMPKRCVVLLGAEAQGLSRELYGLADRTVQIPGSGAVESLNVAASAAVLMAEYYRTK